MSSYKMEEERIIVVSIFPKVEGKSRAPKLASPIATPACGIKARPKYFLLLEVEWVMILPRVAPIYLPTMRTIK